MADTGGNAMLKLTRTKTKDHIVFCLDNTRWRFTKFDKSKLQEALELLYEYQCTGLEPQQVKEALRNLHAANKTIWNLRSKKTTGKWIPVTERLPKESDADDDSCVLAIHKATNKRYFHWRSVADNPFDFTHWMPLPALPTEG